MIPLLLSLAAAYGVYLLYTNLVLGWKSLGPGPRLGHNRQGQSRARDWLVQAGLGDVEPTEFLAVVAVLAAAGGVVGFVIFGGLLPALVLAGFAGSFPIAAYRHRRQVRMAKAQEAWPRMIEEVRLLTGSLGRSIPQALFEVGDRGPEDLRPAFAAAHREWLISTDFAATLKVLKEQLGDPTADATCETLLVAHEVGGSDLGPRLSALAEDRLQDTQGRKDARSKQAGVRFARRFVLIVPLGMAVAGMSVGEGRSAYQTGVGQIAVALSVLMVVGCWLWSGRIMRIPEEERVFEE